MSHAPAEHGHDSHASHWDSHGGSSIFNRKNILGGGAILAGGLAFPETIMTALHGTAGAVQWVLDLWAGALAHAWNSIGAGFVGSLAPLAAPALAGGYIGNKLAQAAHINDKWLKRAATVAGWVVGMGIATSTIAPYLVGGTVAYAIGRKPFKWALEKTGSMVGAAYDAAVAVPVSAAKAALSIPKWVFNAAKSGFQNPTFWPNTSSSHGAAAH